jgi:hypothetical protein
MEPEALAGKIRAKIAAGRLPPPPDPPERVWAGRGEGRTCDGCDEPISGTQIEYEPVTSTQIEYEVDPTGESNDTVSRALSGGLVRSARPGPSQTGGVSPLFPMAHALRFRRWHDFLLLLSKADRAGT